jgi:hypothetical protein
MTHNLAVAADPFSSRQQYLLVGGQYNREGVRPNERPNDGVWLAHWRPGMSSAVDDSAQWLLNGSHSGCVERRVEVEGKGLYPGKDAESRACEFDGRLSLVFHRQRWLLYARSNPSVRGHRFVQVASSRSDRLGSGGDGKGGGSKGGGGKGDGSFFSRFRPVHLRGYNEYDGDVYYFLVQQNPVTPGTLLATFPLYHERAGCVAIAASQDGINWGPPTPLLTCPIVDQLTWRTLCHPTNAVALNSDEVIFYSHVSPPLSDKGADTSKQPPARLFVHRIRSEALRQWTQRSLVAASSRVRELNMAAHRKRMALTQQRAQRAG